MALTRVSNAMLENPPSAEDFINLVEWGLDPTGVADCHALLTTAKETGKALYIPAGANFRLASSFNIPSNFHMYGAGIESSGFTFDAGVEGFSVNTGAEEENIRLHDFFISKAGNWGANTHTGLLLSNVSYSYFDRLKISYFQYGIFLRRTPADPGNPSGHALACYFNFFDQVWTFGCQVGITLAENNNRTVNKVSITRFRAEDNGQRINGLGLDINGVGHSIWDVYAGLGTVGGTHTAAVRLRAASMNCTLIDIYGESSSLDQVILDDTAAGRSNVIVNVHADGVPQLVSRTTPANNSLYLNAGPATNVAAMRGNTVSVGSAVTVVDGGYSAIDLAVSGISYGDPVTVQPPSGWPTGLIRGEPMVSAGNVRLPFFNPSGGSLDAPAGSYRVVWNDIT